MALRIAILWLWWVGATLAADPASSPKLLPANPANNLNDRRSRLESIFQRHLDRSPESLQRGRGQTLLFLPHERFDPGDNPDDQKLTRQFASRLMQLARDALTEEQTTFAWQTLNQAAFFGNPTAQRIVGTEFKAPEARLATSKHPRLGWNRKSYYRVETTHWQIVSRDREAGIEIAKRLESLYAVWQQLFFECWSSSTRLKQAVREAKPVRPRRKKRTLNRVVMFADRAEYNEYLRARQPRIEITLGFYDFGDRTCYFFAGDETSVSTQIHEATHQLFQEVQTPVAPNLLLTNNFWAVEGVAMYMESMQWVGPAVSVGGVTANRLQYARFRALQEKFHVPLMQLVRLGRTELQQDERIRRIYSEAAGLSYFLMDAEDGRYREAFVKFLRLLYQNRTGSTTLSETAGQSLAQLDRDYLRWLRLDDDELLSCIVPTDSLQSLCLGDSDITDRGLRTIKPQRQLEWLDLARTDVTDAGLAFVGEGHSLQQLSLDGTRVTDACLPLVLRHPELDELDLSNTKITDEAIRQLAALKSLRILWLSNTAITDAVVADLSKLRTLESLSIDGTGITDIGRATLQRSLSTTAIE